VRNPACPPRRAAARAAPPSRAVSAASSDPLGLAGTVIGTAIFIVALPINALTLNFKEPARRLILEPAEYTFVRELGDLE
jgi:hypothetical protein